MSNANHKHAARLLARERGINYTTALRLVRDEHVLPAAWTYTYTQAPLAQPPLERPTPSAPWWAGGRTGGEVESLVPSWFFETTADVLSAIDAKPHLLPYFSFESSTIVRHTFMTRNWTPEHHARYPMLAHIDDSLLRQRVMLFEPYAQLRWIAARADNAPFPTLREDEETFSFPGREDLYDDLRDPSYLLSPEVLEFAAIPPNVPDTIRAAFWEGNVVGIGETVSMLCDFLDEWPTSIAGWLLLGELNWAYAHEDGWSIPPSHDEKAIAHAAARMAWEAGVAIGEGALHRSDLPPGFCTPIGNRTGENEPFRNCINALLHLHWVDGDLDRARALGRNLLVLDTHDTIQYRKMKPLHEGHPYPWGHGDNHGPLAMWGPGIDDFEYEAIIARHPARPD